VRSQRISRLRFALVESGAYRFFHVLAGNGASAVLGFLLLVVLTRSLAPASFGNFTKIVNFLDIGIILVDASVFAGAGQVAAKYLKTDPARSDMALKIAFYLRLAIAIPFAFIGVLGASFLSNYMFGDTRYIAELRWAFLCIFPGVIVVQTTSILLVASLFSRLAAVTLLKNALRSILVGALFMLGILETQSVVYSYVAAAFAAAGLSVLLCRFDFLRAKGIDWKLTKQIILVNMWAIIGTVGMLGARVDIFMLGRMSDAHETAYYAVALQLASVVSLFSQSLATFVFPKIAAFSRNEEMQAHVVRCAKIAPLALVPLAMFLPASGWIVPMVFGASYQGAVTSFDLLLISAVLTLLLNPVGLLLFPLGRVDLLAKLAVFQLLLRGTINALLIPPLGAAGAAWSDVLTKSVTVVVLILVLRRFLWIDKRSAVLENANGEASES
jgi:O-antigen/teichoic acid export membrane protein